MAHPSQNNPELTRIFAWLLTGQLAKIHMHTSTIDFFDAIAPEIIRRPFISLSEMAVLANMTNAGATRHVDRLIAAGYLERRNYRSWRFLDTCLTDPTAQKLWRIAQSPLIRL